MNNGGENKTFLGGQVKSDPSNNGKINKVLTIFQPDNLLRRLFA